jgi:hypothetical protein
MPRDPSEKSSRDPENKRASTAAARAAARSTAWAGQKRGKSGYGMESIRPHLRAQLEQQKLMRPTFPPDPDDDSSGSL